MLNASSHLFLSFAKLFVLALIVGSNAFAQIHSEKLTKTMDSLFFNEDGNNRPGYSVAIVKDDSIIYQRSIGHGERRDGSQANGFI